MEHREIQKAGLKLIGDGPHPTVVTASARNFYMLLWMHETGTEAVSNQYDLDVIAQPDMPQTQKFIRQAVVNATIRFGNSLKIALQEQCQPPLDEESAPDDGMHTVTLDVRVFLAVFASLNDACELVASDIDNVMTGQNSIGLNPETVAYLFAARDAFEPQINSAVKEATA